MARPFDVIYIIYNPASTKGGKANASELAVQLRKETLYKIHVVGTKRPAHGAGLAYDIAIRYKSPLIISCSGDGGYNEVVNGALQAQLSNKARPTCVVYASGNANDHSRYVLHEDLVKLIKKGNVRRIDVLQLHANTINRYAHSYIGVGLTAYAGKKINEQRQGMVGATKAVTKAFFSYDHTKIKRRGKVLRISSIVFMNVPEMAKVLKFAKNPPINDGKFEVVIFKKRNLLYLLRKILTASTKGLEANKSYAQYSFLTLQDIEVQLDGEAIDIPTNCKVHISSKERLLRTLR